MEETKPTGKRKGHGQQHQEGLSGINHPGINDVMFGRGGDTNYHIGNNSFRHLVESYQDQYWEATNRKAKAQIIATIIHNWRTQDPPGRFLTKTDPAKGDESLWHDVGDQVAGRKASKILSEMRIGKKKARGGNRKVESAGKDDGGQKKLKATTATMFDQQALASRMPPSVPNVSMLGPESQFPYAFLPTNESLTGIHDIQRQAPIDATNPLSMGHQGMNMWNESALSQERNEFKDPTEDSKIANSIPVAASLTNVFRKDSSSTDESAK